MINFKQKAVINFWSLFIRFLIFSLKLAKPILSRDLKSEISIRKLGKKNYLRMKDTLFKYEIKDKEKVLFFCSSAGEYEQAKPLMTEYEKNGKQPIILFFSMSGINFALKRKEKNPFFLYPFDTKKNARKILRLISPAKIYIVRQEIWPSFLYEAYKLCPIYLIDVSQNESSDGKVSRYVKRTLYPIAKKIFAVSETDKDYLTSKFFLSPEKVFVAGDTKYDSVKLRADSHKDSVESLRNEFKSIYGTREIFIAGSCWPEDAKVFLPYLKEFTSSKKVRAVLAPHKVSEADIYELEQMIKENGLSSARFSERNEKSEEKNLNEVDAVILDTIGQLTDMYGIADFAFVGGANHYQVHNVLEPAIYGIPVTFGPMYKNSHEAVGMIEQNIAAAVSNSKQFKNWLEEQIVKKEQAAVKMKAYIEGLTGATSKILELTSDH